jgi:transcriptional regulator with XRE-family HTH domain
VVDSPEISAKRLRRRRIELGLTQIELAARLGVTNVTVSRWESGTFRVSATRLLEIAEALDTHPELLSAASAPAQLTGTASSSGDVESLSRRWLYALLSDLAALGATAQQLDATHALFLSLEMQRFLDASVDTPSRMEAILAHLSAAARDAFTHDDSPAAAV